MTQAIEPTNSSSQALICNYRFDGSGGGKPQGRYPDRVYVVSELVVNGTDAIQSSHRPL